MNNSSNNVLAANIRKLRESSGYTQDFLARNIGINRSAYANYEAGTREMPLEVIEKLSTIFGCEPYALFDEDFSSRSDVLVCAFRIDHINDTDFEEVCHFKDVVRSYLKIKKIAIGAV